MLQQLGVLRAARTDADDDRRRPPRRCLECGKATRLRKPYCPDHVLLHAYVREVRAHDEALTADAKRPRPGGLLEAEVLVLLRVWRKRTAPWLSRQLPASVRACERVLRNLRRAGLVALSRTRRGSLVGELLTREPTATPDAVNVRRGLTRET